MKELKLTLDQQATLVKYMRETAVNSQTEKKDILDFIEKMDANVIKRTINGNRSQVDFYTLPTGDVETFVSYTLWYALTPMKTLKGIDDQLASQRA